MAINGETNKLHLNANEHTHTNTIPPKTFKKFFVNKNTPHKNFR